MATTTTNFNFPIPQSTDLVKDGATAIAALGTSIDTDFVDLKGGTTGQVLSKASGTDLDFTWVAQDDSNAIQNAIVDAKGDLIAASAADTPARLAVGANGQVLVADSTAATGLKWATGGKVLQVVEGTYATAGTSSTSTYADSGLTATITPTSATSKIIVLAVVPGCGKFSSDTSLGLRLLRNASVISNSVDIGVNGSIITNFVGSQVINKLDSPSTTSATTYKVQFRSNANTGTVSIFSGNSEGSIILMEIGA